MEAESCSIVDRDLFVRASLGVESAEKEVLALLESKYRKVQSGMHPFGKEDDRFYETDYVIEGSLCDVETKLEEAGLHVERDRKAGLGIEIGRIRVGEKTYPVCISVFWLHASLGESSEESRRVLTFEVTSLVAHHGWAEQWLKATTGYFPSHHVEIVGHDIVRDLEGNT